MTRDGTAELVLRGQILRRERQQGGEKNPCSVDYEQVVDPYAICDGDTYIQTISDTVSLCVCLCVSIY